MYIKLGIAKWLQIALAITSCGMLVDATEQYILRSELNDPQIKIVGDVTNALERGAPPAQVVPRYVFDAEKSLSPFIAVYDATGTPLESSASIGDVPPKPPIGVFEYAKSHRENRVTWQPNKDTRIALVIRPVLTDKGWFVESGRNMKEVEGRIKHVGLIVFLGTLCALLTTLALELFGAYRHALTKI